MFQPPIWLYTGGKGPKNVLIYSTCPQQQELKFCQLKREDHQWNPQWCHPKLDMKLEEAAKVLLAHYQKTGENQQNYRRKYFVDSYYQRTKFRLKICWYIPTVSPTDYTFCLERCNDVVTWSFFRRFYLWNDRGIQTEIVVQWHGTVTDGITDGITDRIYPSVIPSVKTIIYTPSADTLFLCFSFFFFPIPPLPSQTAANHLSQLSTILNTSTQVSYTLYVVTIFVSCGFYHFFVSKSILFSFNI